MIEAEAYAHDILKPGNELMTGRLMKLAAQRFLDDLERTDIEFDEEQANLMVNFCERYCYQWEGDWRGVSFKFEPWQKFIFQQVYGWIVKATGRRRINEVYVQVAKKNGKSTMAAGLALFHIFADTRVNTPKVFTAANNEDQAKICVNMAGRVIEQSEDLFEYVEDGRVTLSNYRENVIGVVHREKDGFIKAFSKESDDKKSKQSGGKHGVNASLGIVDEFGMSPDHGASKTIKTSMAARFEYLMAYITTAGFNLDGPCYQELRQLGIACLEKQIIRDNYLPIIYELDDHDDYKDEANWQKCNPNLNVSVNKEFLKQMVQDAVQKGGSTEVDVKTLNFNKWCHSAETFIPQEKWDLNTHGITEAELEGVECFGGIHIVNGMNLNSFALLFPNVRPDVHAVKIFPWIPEDSLLNNETKTDFSKWRKYMSVCPGNVIDNDWVFNQIHRAISRYNVNSVAAYNSILKHDIVQALVRSGIIVNPITQSYTGLSTPTKEWESLLHARRIEHFNSPVLSWMNSNCLVLRKADEIQIQSAGGKTTGVIAAINAFAQWKTISATELDDKYVESW